MYRLLSVSVLGFAIACSSLWAQDVAEIAANENPSIVKWANGKYMYRVADDQRQRGFEEFRMVQHLDGSRTYTMWYSVFEDHMETSSVLRVDKEFRPMSMYKTTWVNDVITTTNTVVDGDKMTSRVQVNDFVFTDEVEVPDEFSLMIGPITADALHFSPYDFEQGGEQSYTVVASVSAGASEQAIGKAMKADETNVGLKVKMPSKIEWLGKETIEVPAGTFETNHFLMPGMSEMWLTEPDFTLIKYKFFPGPYEYELIEFASGPQAP